MNKHYTDAYVKQEKKLIIILIAILLFLIWAELGVGIFGTLFAGY